MPSMAALTKAPGDVLDYVIDYSVWLGADTIDTSTWNTPPGLSEDSDSNTTTTTTVWLSEGQVGQVYRVTNTITTVGGRTKTMGFDLRITD